MAGDAKSFLLIVAASVVASILSTYIVNNVRAVRRVVGSL